MKLLPLILLPLLPTVLTQGPDRDTCINQVCSQTILPTPPECQKTTFNEWAACICPHAKWAGVIANCIQMCKPEDRGFVQACPGGSLPFSSSKSVVSVPVVTVPSTTTRVTTAIVTSISTSISTSTMSPAPVPTTVSEASSVKQVSSTSIPAPPAPTPTLSSPTPTSSTPIGTPSIPTPETSVFSAPLYTGPGVTTKTFSDHTITISTRPIVTLPTLSSSRNFTSARSSSKDVAPTASVSGAGSQGKMALWAGMVLAAMGVVV